MKNDITAVRNLLIETAERLLNPEEGETLDVAKAKAIAQLGKVLVESAKAEANFLAVAEKAGHRVKGTGFIGKSPADALPDGK